MGKRVDNGIGGVVVLVMLVVVVADRTKILTEYKDIRRKFCKSLL